VLALLPYNELTFGGYLPCTREKFVLMKWIIVAQLRDKSREMLFTHTLLLHASGHHISPCERTSLYCIHLMNSCFAGDMRRILYPYVQAPPEASLTCHDLLDLCVAITGGVREGDISNAAC
jgi:hypothetical protein